MIITFRKALAGMLAETNSRKLLVLSRGELSTLEDSVFTLHEMSLRVLPALLQCVENPLAEGSAGAERFFFLPKL